MSLIHFGVCWVSRIYILEIEAFTLCASWKWAEEKLITRVSFASQKCKSSIIFPHRDRNPMLHLCLQHISVGCVARINKREKEAFSQGAHPENGLKENWQLEDVFHPRDEKFELELPLQHISVGRVVRINMWEKEAFSFQECIVEMGWRKVDNLRMFSIPGIEMLCYSCLCSILV